MIEVGVRAGERPRGARQAAEASWTMCAIDGAIDTADAHPAGESVPKPPALENDLRGRRRALSYQTSCFEKG
jgi:hypothetical protein